MCKNKCLFCVGICEPVCHLEVHNSENGIKPARPRTQKPQVTGESGSKGNSSLRQTDKISTQEQPHHYLPLCRSNLGPSPFRGPGPLATRQHSTKQGNPPTKSPQHIGQVPAHNSSRTPKEPDHGGHLLGAPQCPQGPSSYTSMCGVAVGDCLNM